MSFSAILNDIDPAFPEGSSTFWSFWIPVLERAIADCCPRPYGHGALKVSYLEREEGGFEFTARTPGDFTWLDGGVPVDPVTKNSTASQIRTQRRERYGDAVVVDFFTVMSIVP